MLQTYVCICIKYLSFFLCPKLIMPQIQLMNNQMNAFPSDVSSLHLVSVPILLKNMLILSFEDIACFEPLKVKNESEVAQSCLTLCDPMDYSLPGSSVHGIFQARVLEWGASVFSGILSIYLLSVNPWASNLRLLILYFLNYKMGIIKEPIS